MKVLFLSRWFPEPANNGAKIRILNVLRQLASEHDIDLVSFRESDEPIEDVGAGQLKQLCCRIVAVPYRPYQPSRLSALLALYSSRPRFLVDTANTAMFEAVSNEFARCRPDVVVASQIDMMPYALELRGVPLVFEELELSRYLDAVSPGRRFDRRLRATLTWWKLRSYLRRMLPRFSACTVVSRQECDLARKVAPNDRMLKIVPNAVDLADYRGDFGSRRPNTLIYSGALSFVPNFDAVSYFVDEIYPRVRREVADVEFQITGKQNGIDPAILPRGPGVSYTGYVDDIRPVVARSEVAVVPLRHGGGTRLKILEAMALGTPIVTTSKGAEGLDVTDGDNILIADDPDAFARRVVELLRSPELRQRLAIGGQRLVNSTYNWRVVGGDLRALLDQVVGGDGVRPNWQRS